jgi:hypothetical protein
MRTGRAIGVFCIILLLCAAAAVISIRSARAQVGCNQTGNHLIKISKAQGSDQLVDCELSHISKKAKHKITWQASGKDTITIEFPANANPFLNFSCQDQKHCTADQIDPKAQGQYKYTVTLKSGGTPYKEDPGVIIEQ